MIRAEPNTEIPLNEELSATLKANGVSNAEAAQRLGISKSTFGEWLIRISQGRGREKAVRNLIAELKARSHELRQEAAVAEVRRSLEARSRELRQEAAVAEVRRSLEAEDILLRTAFREYLNAAQTTITGVAKVLGIHRSSLSDWLNERRRFSPEFEGRVWSFIVIGEEPIDESGAPKVRALNIEFANGFLRQLAGQLRGESRPEDAGNVHRALDVVTDFLHTEGNWTGPDIDPALTYLERILARARELGHLHY
jgi:transposase